MRLLAASSITFTDLSDASSAMLSSDVLLVPCDSMGVPKLALGSSPLTSRMIILQGGVEQSGWSFSRTQQGVTSAVDSSGVVSVTAISADNGYVEVTATKTGHSPLTKKLTVSKVYQGETGDAAKDFSVFISPATYRLTARGIALESQTITLICNVVNMDVTADQITWQLLSGNAILAATTGLQNSLLIEPGIVPESMTIQCTVVGHPSKTLVINGIREGTPQTQYLGEHDNPPLYYNGIEPIIVGDFYLDSNNLPQVYRGPGVGWVPYTRDIPGWNEAALKMVGDATRDGKTVPSQSIVYAWIENLAATNASIGKLFASLIEIPPEGVIQSIGFDEETSTAGFSLSGGGRAVLIDALIKGSVTSDIVNSDSLKTYKEELSTQVVSVSNVASAWEIPAGLSPLFSNFNKQPEVFFTPGSSTYKGKTISQVGICTGAASTILYSDGTRSRGFKESSSTWLTYTLNSAMLGSAYKLGQSYRMTVNTSFIGDWADQSINLIRGGVQTTLASGRNTSLCLDVTLYADDTITFWGGNSAWAIFGTKTMYVYAFTIHSIHAGSAPFVSQAQHGNTSKSNATAAWVYVNVGNPVTVPLGARYVRLFRDSQAIAAGTNLGSHYLVKVVVNGTERQANYQLGERSTQDIDVPEGSSVQLRLYVHPQFTVISYDDEGNPTSSATYTPSISMTGVRSIFVSERSKGLMFLYSDNTSEFLPYAGLSGSSYTETVLSLSSSSSFPYTVNPTKTRYTLTAIKEEFAEKGFGIGSVVTCAAAARPTLNVNSTTYMVNRIFIYANHIMFSTAAGDVVVYDFNTNKALYTLLTLSTVTPVTQKGENRTKHLTPMENAKYSIGDRANGLLYDKVSAMMGDFDAVQAYGNISASGQLSGLSLAVQGHAAYGCRAWVNFNGTGAVSKRASENVSSIGDLGTGYYQVNFANAMADSNIVVNVSCGLTAGSGFPTPWVEVVTNTYVKLKTGQNVNTYSDNPLVMLSVHR
ncbi:MAG: hypothetical protein VB088_02115 [Sphaerochaeta sp.]|nr:hypothetical protein [Sphaerochaeta sp.]